MLAPSALRARFRLRYRLARCLLSACVAGSLGFVITGEVLAAPPATAAVYDDDESDETSETQLVVQQEEIVEDPPPVTSNQEVPEIPETFVPGRATFPAQPLPENVAITPTRTDTRIGGTGTALTVITQDEIQRSGQSSVAEVLRGRVGLDVVRSGPLGGQTSVFLRGANSQQTKVLLDGIPINDPSSATRGFDFSTLETVNIERIEILRGPQSLLYGSDAIGGVINIITKRGNGPAQFNASGYGGTFGTGRVGGGVSGGDERSYYSLAGSYLSTDGISAASKYNGNTEKDGYKNGTVSGRFGYTPSDTVNVDYVFRYTHANAQVDDFDFGTGLPIDNFIRENLLDSFANRVQLQSLFVDGGVEQIIGFNLTDYRREDTDPGLFVPPHYQGQSRQIDAQWNFLLTDTNTFTAATQYYVEDASSTFDPQQSQNNAGIFLQDQWQLRENWYAGVGVRWDDNSRAGKSETYRANSVYTVVPTNTDFHGSIGTGFRAPALAENLFAFGNPNLRPEQSKGWDVGATQRFNEDRMSIDATYFRNDFEDLIVFDFNSFTLENVGRSRASGVEVTGDWKVTDDMTLFANYTLTDTKDLDTGLALLRRPRDKMSVGFDQYFWARSARLGGRMIYVGDRLDTGNTTLDQYTIVNFNGSYYFSPQTELFARIDNAFNEKYEEVRGFGVQGIAGYAGLNLLW